MLRKKFTDVRDAFALAHAIVATLREPIVVLDQELRVIVAATALFRTSHSANQDWQLAFSVQMRAAVFETADWPGPG